MSTRERRILVLLAHPVLEKSRVNRRMADAIAGLPGVTLHDLYEEYPTLDIDVPREQKLLSEHDVIVFQHPFYWYSVPAILKEWQDLVLEHGWAYGEHGHALDGKITFNAVSAGGPQTAYHREGHNRFTVRELLAPWDQTAHLCRMKWLPPFAVHASLRLEGDDDIRPFVLAYEKLLRAMHEGTLDLDRAASLDSLNELVAS